VIGAEEMDWIVADAAKLFHPYAIQTAGAGAVYLKTEKPATRAAELAVITDAFSFSSAKSRATAARNMRVQLPVCAGDNCCASERKVCEQGHGRTGGVGRLAW